MFLSLKTLYRKRTVIWPFYFYTIIRTLSKFEYSYSLIFSDKNLGSNVLSSITISIFSFTSPSKTVAFSLRKLSNQIILFFVILK
ncbi:hypothetical protein CUS52_02865 [Enterococcus faecium]|nr:hypothetical protein CUS52_02865 [Enterococcus faecium]